jgi:Second Messenger Oligonucleotide or Dinucleotide Synthetase domain
MGGSGGGSTFHSRTPDEARRQVRDAEDKTTVAAFESTLSEILGGLLGTYNSRDHELVGKRLADVKDALGGEIEGGLDQLFGGSVAKHTYVDGLSDIDSLVFVNDTSLEGQKPQAVLAKMEKIIRKSLKGEAEVDHGRMAVTVTFNDGMVIQLLPAMKTDGGHLRVPSSRTEKWSKINPVAFHEVLTKRNEQCGGKLIPTIKLAKAINGQLPESQRLSGYHMESLAIAAFREYKGPRTTTAMLPAFFERSKELVLSPISDKSGQSVHVDAYLGDANSEARQMMSHVLGRLARRMRNATAAGSTEQWRAMFGLE